MRVVELRGPFLVQGRGRAAEERVNAEHVLQRATAEKELLLEAQFLARRNFIIRIEHLADVFRGQLVLHGAVVIAVIESSEIEGLDRLRSPKAEDITCPDAVAGDRRVVGDAFYFGFRNPAHAEAAGVVGVAFTASAELHLVSRSPGAGSPRDCRAAAICR